MSFLRVMTVLAILAVSTTARSAEFVHEQSGLKFKLPSGWTCTEKDNKLFIESKDRTLSCVGGVIPQASAKAIFADIQKFVDSIDGFGDVEVMEGPERETVNGLEQAWYAGTATLTSNGEENEIEWDMTIVTGGRAVLFLAGTGDLENNEEAYEEFFESIKKIEKEARAE